MDQDRIIKVDINETMKSSYIDYSMSVIVSRALPDVRDGFKPVHRRILFDMMEQGITADKPTKKSARIVGDVLGKYHPHGDSSVYGALVRLAQPWAMRYTLVDGQGNFGSVDGDGAAAMRYTEARLTKLGEAMMDDLYKDTVDFQPTYDDSDTEPTVLSTRIPNLLVNGATGIAVGMATNIPTHNLGEVIDGCVAYIDNPDIDVEGLMHYIKGPDFPTGGIICGVDGIKEAYETGRGRIIIRSKTEFETDGQHEKIIVNEIPYNVNKSELIKRIADLVTEKKLEGISNINDESDREGMRIVIDLKREANSNVVLNKLYKMTELQSSFSVNCIAIVRKRPKTLTLKDCIKEFVEHRHDVTIRRTKFDKKKAEERAHLLEALIIASDNIDEVVQIIKSSKNPQDAQTRLMERFGFDEPQAKYVVDMRLSQLTGLQQERLHAEYDELERLIAYLQQILDDPELCKKVMKDELIEVKEKYGDERKTIIDPRGSQNFNPEDFYADDACVVTISHLGYIKRTPLTEFRTQARGGVGSKGGSAREADFIEHIYPATGHNTMMFFTQKGRCYWMKVYDIPEGNKTFKGRAIQNMLNIDSDDKATAFVCIKNINDPEFVESHNLVFCTKHGLIKKTAFANYSRPRTNGIIAINLNEGDTVKEVLLTTGTDEILIANRNGRAIRFIENTVRVMGRGAAGVRALKLDDDGQDEIVGMIVMHKPEDMSEEDMMNDPNIPTVLVVSEKGFGKRSSIYDYRITNRNGKGVKTLNITEKTGKLIAIKSVTDDDDLMIINKSGITIRLPLKTVKVQGRNTQGVSLINLKKRNDVIASVCKVEHEEVEDEELEIRPDADGQINMTYRDDTSADTEVSATTDAEDTTANSEENPIEE
ncbi:MAG: DNA gyrase subunit A [Bacteroidaceae bacterium]|nr:DNA gyrase subunit A [Bacteroidaceae bacterium]